MLCVCVRQVERWVQEVDRIRPSKRVDKKLNGVQRAPPGQPVVEQPPDPPSCMVNWKDQSVNLSAKLQTLLTSIGVSDRQEALEKTRTKAVKSPTSVIRIGESPLWEVPGNPMTGPSAPGEYTDF